MRTCWGRKIRSLLLIALCVGLGLGCQPPSGDASASGADDVSSGPEKAPLLPRFEGVGLGGQRISTDALKGRRAIIYIFTSTDPHAELLAEMMQRFVDLAPGTNLGLLGVNRDVDPASALAFAKKYGFEFPIIQDKGLVITRKLGMPADQTGLLAVNAEGEMLRGFVLEGDDIGRYAQSWEDIFRKDLFLPVRNNELDSSFGLFPQAPDFAASGPGGRKTSLEELEGKVIVLVFFQPTCPHCHEALQFLDKLNRKLSSADLAILPISVMDRQYLIEDMVKKLGISCYPCTSTRAT